MTKKTIFPRDLVSMVQILLYIKAFTWAILSIIYFTSLYTELVGQFVLIAVISILMFVNGVIMFALAILIKRKNKLIYYGAVAYLILNIILTFADQFGIPDLLSLLVDLTIVIMLIRGKKEFFVKS